MGAAVDNRGRGVIDAIWVETGPRFALDHALAQRLGGVWWVVGWCGLAAALAAAWIGFRIAGLLGPQPVHWSIAIFLPLNMLMLVSALAALPCLFLRNPMASFLVWIVLVLSFPLSLPLVFYWKDGVRPNLVYRHRFAKLVEMDGRGDSARPGGMEETP